MRPVTPSLTSTDSTLWKIENVVVAALALALFSWAWWVSVSNNNIKIVLDGWSPIDWVYQLALPQNFTKNFASGIENYDKSLPMLAYPFAYRSLGIEPEALLPWFIGAEIVALVASMIFLVRTLFPKAPSVMVFIVVALAVASRTRAIDLAQFGGPHFLGLYYVFADALRVTVIALVIRQRFLAAGFVLGLTTATHVTLALITAALVAFMHLATPTRLKQREPWLGAGVFVLFAITWIVLTFRSAGIATSGIPSDQWLTLTQMFSYHWYPVANDLLTSRRQAAFVPLLSYLLLVFYFLGRVGLHDTVSRQLRAGFLGLIAVTCVGLLVSSLAPFPTLIKIALHRASDALVLAAMPVVAIGLIREITTGPVWRAALSGAILVSPLAGQSVFPILLGLLLTLPAWRSLRAATSAYPGDVLVAWSAIAIVTYLITAEIAWGRIEIESYAGGQTILVALCAFAAAAIARRWPPIRSATVYLAALVVTVCGIHFLDGKRINWRAEASAAYREAQDWARTRTPNDALFLVDPTIYYGWRDFSRRSSFGNLREWLHTSWLYDSRADQYREGLRRLNDFGLTPDAYAGRRPAITGHLELQDALEMRFYHATDKEIATIARKNAAAFIVARKSPEPRRRSLPIAFENNHYVIYRVADK